MRSFVTHTAFAFAGATLTAGLVAFTDPASAAAAVRDGAPQLVVKVDDPDLRSAPGRQTAERVCRATAGNGRGTEMRCRDRAVGEARQALDARVAAL